MSGDFGPKVIVPASIKSLLLDSTLKIFLVGDPIKISKFIKKDYKNIKNRIKIIPTESIISNDINLLQAIRKKNKSSMKIAIELVKSGKASACISAGNTKILTGLSKLLLKPLKNIKRPALISYIPNCKKSYTLILDLGANIKCSSNMLIQFAIMGSIFSKYIFNISNPRVALLNIGKEINTGLNSIQNAANFLKKYSKINYTGYIEGNDILNGKIDVLVCNGFVGNVMLKTMEGIIKMNLTYLKDIYYKERNYWFFKKKENSFKKKILKKISHFNPDYYNGAFLLGLQKIVVKSHGAANKRAFFIAIQKASQIIKKQILEKISIRLDNVLPKNK